VLDLPAWTRAGGGLKSETVELGPLLDEVIPTVEPQLKRQVAHHRALLRAGPADLEGRSDLLKQVLVNLINNAAKFSRESTPS